MDDRDLPDAPGTRASAPVPPRPRTSETLADEQEISLDDLRRILRRRAGTIAGTLLLVVAAVALYTLTRTPVWEASALIRVEGGTGELFQDQALVSLGPDDIETEMRVVATRPILERAVDDLDLHFRVAEPREASRELLLSEISFDRTTPFARYELTGAADGGYRLRTLEPDTPRVERAFAPGEAVEIPGGRFVLAPPGTLTEAGRGMPERLVLATVPFEEAVRGLGGRLEVSRPNPRAQLFQVSYRSPDRRLVPEVVNAVAQAFLTQRQAVHQGEARGAVAFLREQTAQIQAQLEAAEEALQEFREERRVVALDAEAREQVGRLAELQAQRASLAAERDALTQLLRAIDAGEQGDRPDYRTLVAFPTFLRNQTVGTLVQSLVQAETRRTEMRERWSPAHPGIVALDSTIHDLEARLGEIGRDYLQSLNDQITSLDAGLARFGSDLERVPGRELQFARLERRVTLLTDLHSLLEQRLKEAEVTEALADPTVRVAEAAILPREPVSPRPARNLALAGFLGLMLGVGLAFVREATDDRIHGDEDLEGMLGAPVLARIPGVGSGPRRARGGPRAGGRTRRAADRDLRAAARVTIEDGRSRRAEAYRALRTNVAHLGPARASGAGAGAGGSGGSRPEAREPQEIVVTSPGTKEGKSVTASNLAAAFARQGRRTLLVDADLRRGVQHRVFGGERVPGLSELLRGEAGLEEAIRRTEDPDLDLVAAGAAPADPTELLDGPGMDAFLARVREAYDAVVFDSPPTLAVADASVLASRATGATGPRGARGAILVVRAERTPRQAARDAIEQLRRVEASLLGVVVNDAKPDARYGSDYASYHDDRGDGGGLRSRLRRLLPFVEL